MDFEIMKEMFEKSRTENKGLTVYLAGHSVPIIVKAVHGMHTVEGRNQHFGKIVLRIDQIVGLASS